MKCFPPNLGFVLPLPLTLSRESLTGMSTGQPNLESPSQWLLPQVVIEYFKLVTEIGQHMDTPTSDIQEILPLCVQRACSVCLFNSAIWGCCGFSSVSLLANAAEYSSNVYQSLKNSMSGCIFFYITFLLDKRSKELEEKLREEPTSENWLPACMVVEGRSRKSCHLETQASECLRPSGSDMLFK